jgi:hypothetical protein
VSTSELQQRPADLPEPPLQEALQPEPPGLAGPPAATAAPDSGLQPNDSASAPASAQPSATTSRPRRHPGKAHRKRPPARLRSRRARAVGWRAPDADPALEYRVPEDDGGLRAVLVELERTQAEEYTAGIALSSDEIASLPFAAGPDDVLPWEDEEPPGDLSYCVDDADQASWVAALPPELRAIWDAPPWTGDGEVFPAGFSHNADHDGHLPEGAGFAAGGMFDQMLPDPRLAAAVFAAAGGNTGPRLAGLGESELIGVACAWQRLTAWTQAGQAAALATLVARRNAQSVARREPGLAAHVSEEAAAALTLSGQAATRLLEISVAVSALPSVRTALADGRIDWAKATMFADLLAGIPPGDAADIADSVIRRAQGRTTGQLRAALTRAVLSWDPEAAQRRREQARRDACVQTWPEPSGNAALAGRELEPGDAITASTRLTALARWLKKHGASGSIDQLRAAAYIALLTGRPVTDLLPPGATGDPAGSADGHDSSGGCSPGNDARQSGSATANTRREGGPVRQSENGHDGQPRSDRDLWSHGAHQSRDADSGIENDADPIDSDGGWPRLTGTINLTMPLATFVGAADRPGELAGHGAVDPDTCRTLANRTDAATRWCLTLTGTDGQAVAHACANGPPPGAGERRPDPTRPNASADNISTDNISTDNARPDSDGHDRERAEPEHGGPQGAGPGGAGTSSTGTGETWTASTWAAGAWAAGARAAGAWAEHLRGKLQYLERGICGHARQSPRYRPPPTLLHLIRVRQARCSFPGCRRPGRRTDLDHTLAWAKGGLTCECNLAPLCRRHHQTKQAEHWALAQPEPGTLVWTTPAGRRYTTVPDAYPV